MFIYIILCLHIYYIDKAQRRTLARDLHSADLNRLKTERLNICLNRWNLFCIFFRYYSCLYINNSFYTLAAAASLYPSPSVHQGSREHHIRRRRCHGARMPCKTQLSAGEYLTICSFLAINRKLLTRTLQCRYMYAHFYHVYINIFFIF